MGQDSNNDINSVFPVDDSKNEIMFSTDLGYFLLSKVWFKL